MVAGRNGNAGRSLGVALGVGVLSFGSRVYGAAFSMEDLYYFTTCSLVNFTVPLL